MVFFENFACVSCGHPLGFDPHSLMMVALVPAATTTGMAALWDTAIGPTHNHAVALPLGPFKRCRNHVDYGACNFLLAADDAHEYCVSCRQTHTIPNLSKPGNLEAWITIENAKRRLYYTLARLGLEGLATTPAYDFLEDVPGEDPVLTGHANGLITINIAEADDAERTRRRIALHEPYRTLLGHLRHEVGHFYWDRFFLGNLQALEQFRQIFGDEREDYAEALERHYHSPRTDWQGNYISSYATAHAWEDWAETWAHYLHLIDLLETAAAYQMSFATLGSQGYVHMQAQDPFAYFASAPRDGSPQDIGALLNLGMGVSLVLNSLNRSLGQNDAYPFTLPTPVLGKLSFVHNVVQAYVRDCSNQS